MKRKSYIPLRKLQPTDFKEDFQTICVVFGITIINMWSENLKEILTYYILMGNMIWILLSSKTYPNALTKELYLCPMTKGEQKKYLLKHYREKIIGNMLIATGVNFLFVAIGWMQTTGMTLLLVSQLLINLTSHLYMDTSEIRRSHRSEEYSIKGYEVSRNSLIGIGLICWLILFFDAVEGAKELSAGVLITISIQAVTSLLFLKVYSKPLFECGMDSELNYLHEVGKKEVKK